MMMALVAVFGLLAASQAACAVDTRTEVKARMEQRLPQVNELKARAVVGENDKGLLAISGKATATDKALVAAENNDRRIVYAAIAAKTGSTPEAVAARRARKIAESASAGAKQ